MIEFKNVTKRFGSQIAVDNLDIDLADGTLTMLIGPSGCGKTTTLRMINRLTEPNEGEILINGTKTLEMDPVQLRREIGYVIQEVGLFPHYTVFDNIATVPRLHKWDESKIKDRVFETLEMVTLDGSYAYKYPAQLSGGERQRVGLARALSPDPDVLLMDEPFGAIDPINRLVLQEAFLEIQEEIKKTIVFVTHDINEAIKLGDKLVIMQDGKVIQHDKVNNILEEPANEFVEDLLGHDRSLKALSLKRVKDFMYTDGYLTAPKDASRDEVAGMLKGSDQNVVYGVDEAGNLKGAFFVEATRRDKGVVYREKYPYIERNVSVTDTLSSMLEVGEKQLPVVNRRGKLVGFIRLSDIFDQVDVAQGSRQGTGGGDVQ